MKARDIQKAGIPAGPLLRLALSLMGPATQGWIGFLQDDRPRMAVNQKSKSESSL